MHSEHTLVWSLALYKWTYLIIINSYFFKYVNTFHIPLWLFRHLFNRKSTLNQHSEDLYKFKGNNIQNIWKIYHHLPAEGGYLNDD